MVFSVRELSPIETHDLRRRVSAAGRISLPSWNHELDEALGSWHLGAVDSQGTVVAIATFFQLPFPSQPEVAGAYRLQFMAVEPLLQRSGLGTLVLTEGVRRLQSAGVPLLWATARLEAIPFYQRFGFAVFPALESEVTDQATILLDLRA
ncbi:MAG: GNAT family N-acetyltransferase [Candidatus Dormibacterales bacterium]